MTNNIGQLNVNEASVIYTKMSGLMVAGLLVGGYLLYTMLIKR